MNEVFEKSDRLIRQVPQRFTRKVPGNLDWDWRLNAIVGARGKEKTTLMKQRANKFKNLGREVLYVSFHTKAISLSKVQVTLT